MKRYLAILLSALLTLFAPLSVVAQCVIPANTAVMKTTSYAALAADAGKLIVMNCSSACTLTLPATPQSPVWTIWVASIGSTQAVVSPNGLTLNGSTSSVTVPPGIGQGFIISTDNANYFASGLTQQFYAAGGGTAQAQTALPTNTLAAYSDGLVVCWKPTAANTGAGPTLAVSGLSAVTVTKIGATALLANDLVTTAIACAIYNSSGPRFELQDPQAVAQYAKGKCEVHIWGTGASSVLQDTDDELASCYNGTGVTESITAVRCWADAGSPTVLPAVTGGSNLLSGNLTCGTASWANGTLNGSPTLAAAGTIDDNIVTAGGTAKTIRIVIEYTY
jgi:hypothetical protein